MWTLTIPNKPGWYFFYGTTSGVSSTPRLHVVQVLPYDGGGVWFMATWIGMFAPEYHAKGWWQLIPTPTLPQALP